MAPHSKKILATIACLAIAFGQILGLQRGFICDFGDRAHMTQVDHCHGHAPHDDNDRHGHDEDPWNCSIQSAEGDEHKHAVNIESFRASVAHSAQVIIPPPAFTSLLTPTWPEIQLPTFKCRFANASFVCRTNRLGIPWPRVLTHTLALRI